MRIVIDMQGLQTISLIRGIGRYILSLVKAIVRKADNHEIFLILNANFPERILDVRSEFANLLSEQSIRIFDAPLSTSGNGEENGWQMGVTEIIYKHFILSLKPDHVILTEGSSEVGSIKLGLSEQQVMVLNGEQEYADINASALRIIETWQAIEHRKEQEASNASHCNFPERRPRLAFISPLPPEKTGIADYSAELLPELERYYDIELITNQQEVNDLCHRFFFPIRSVEWFKLHAKTFDRVLYHIGNNLQFHGYMFALLKDFPGVVVLHDFFLSHAMFEMEKGGILPDAWTDSLFQSHGYAALHQRCQSFELDRVLWRYPCNLNLLQSALGVIVHSQNAQRLAKQWIDERAGAAWTVIPLLRKPAQISSRADARAALGINTEQFVVCSFGMLGPNKLNQRLLDAWLSSVLSKNEECLLIFVGENDPENYGKKLLSTIKESGFDNRIHITGWTDTTQFRDYLMAADLGVQLRSLSRGETSAAVLDCMNYGLPTIVNANGAMADLPTDAVWKLPDEFTDAELEMALVTLWTDVERRHQMGDYGKETILTRHNPGTCAYQYSQVIESAYQRSEYNQRALIQALADSDSLTTNTKVLQQIANAVATSFPPGLLPRQLLFDTSNIMRHDQKTGIERVVRSQLLELIKNPPKGFRVEPVYLSDQGGKWHYRYARSYTCKILDIEPAKISDTVIDVASGDVFYAADFFPGGVIEAAKSGLYLQWQALGVSINFLIHDLLPIQNPRFFPDGANSLHVSWLKTIAEFSTHLLCITHAVANELLLWLESNHIVRQMPLMIDVIHLGADINASAPSAGLPKISKKLLNKLSLAPTFIMVGTLEPRKGYLQAISAFDLLWKQGHQVNLVLVGKQGWMSLPDDQRRNIPQLMEMLHQNQQLGNRLFWLKDISDEYLQQLYAMSVCLIAASEGEGFGLPLIEAAQHKVPIIARDIPVFREVAGEYAYYFKGLAALDLEQAVIRWLALYKNNTHPLSDNMPYLTWAKNVSQVGSVLSQPRYNKVENLNSLLYSPKKNLYVDITVVYRDDYKTGIQRVVRAILSELLKNPPSGYNVCAVYLGDIADRWCYYSVQTDSSSAKYSSVNVNRGDIILGLDFACGFVVEAFRHDLYSKFMAKGALVYFVVYDLLPVLMPDFFSDQVDRGHEQWLNSIALSDGVICISKAVANDFVQWFKTKSAPLPAYFLVDYFHLGADITASDPTKGLPWDAGIVLSSISAYPSFLMVGTLEPRKGYGQALAAFEQLWAQGLDVNLVIVGKQGWKMEVLIDRLRNHQERGLHLYLLEGVSDEYLEKLYESSTCLIAASEGEGFGLPLIEAAQHKVPIIARDIPVFREVAGDNAYFFRGLAPETLAAAIKEWLILYEQGFAPSSTEIEWLTWEQSSLQLVQKIVPRHSLKILECATGTQTDAIRI